MIPDPFGPIANALVEIAGLSGADWSDCGPAQSSTWDEIRASVYFRRYLLNNPDVVAQAVLELREGYDEATDAADLGGQA